MRSVRNIFSPLTVIATVPLEMASLCSAATITLSPINPRQLSNSSLQFTAKVNGKDITKLMQWSSSNPAVATIDKNGTASLLSAGTSTITATGRTTIKRPSASTTLTVTTAMSPLFTAQPTDTNVSAVIDSAGGVKVQTLDNLGDPLVGLNVTISIATNPPGTGTLGGTLAQTTDSTGTATFPDLVLTFEMAKMKLSSQAVVVRLSGWLKNSQAFFGESKIRVAEEP